MSRRVDKKSQRRISDIDAIWVSVRNWPDNKILEETTHSQKIAIAKPETQES